MQRLSLGLGLLLAACAPIAGNGVPETETRDVDGFDGVGVEGGLRVEVVVGLGEPLTVTTDANLLEHVHTEVADDALNIHPDPAIEPTIPVELHLGVPSLDFVSARETGSVALAHRVAAQRFGVAASEGATTQAGGTCELLRAIASDQGSINAASLVCANGRIDAQSGARVEVTVTGTVEVHAAGESEVVIHGNPTLVGHYVTDDSVVTVLP